MSDFISQLNNLNSDAWHHLDNWVFMIFIVVMVLISTFDK